MNLDIKKTKSWIIDCVTEDTPSSQPHPSVKEKAITYDFLDDIRCLFEHYLKAFNEIKEEENKTSSSHPSAFKNSIFIYDLAETTGFMLFKKDFKLIFSYVSAGRIRIKFLKQRVFSEREVLASSYLNLLHKDMLSINWIHEGKKGFVDIDILVRYYMKRFLQEV